jgi:hypothetical protein
MTSNASSMVVIVTFFYQHIVLCARVRFHPRVPTIPSIRTNAVVPFGTTASIEWKPFLPALLLTAAPDLYEERVLLI